MYPWPAFCISYTWHLCYKTDKLGDDLPDDGIITMIYQMVVLSPGHTNWWYYHQDTPIDGIITMIHQLMVYQCDDTPDIKSVEMTDSVNNNFPELESKEDVWFILNNY